MSGQQQYAPTDSDQIPPEPFTPAAPPVTTPPNRKSRNIGSIVAAVLLLGLGYGFGHGTAGAPQSCLDALDNADTLFGYAAQEFNAAARFDTATIEGYATKVDNVAPAYNTHKSSCRAAGLG